ncbi:MAG: hypothetical protein KAS87_01550 [Candidatus Omnitrophica bacterium]|nr:hypothetical protein [Candidatus Omnitrophota bacterium]
MLRNKYIAGLDIGSNKISLVIGGITKQRKLEIIDFQKVDSKGIRQGIVIDLTKAINSILEIKQKLRSKGIKSVFASVNGKNVKSHFNHAVLNLSPRGEEIRQSHLDKLLKKASAIGLPLNRQIIYRVPLEYIVDGEAGITNPLRMTANRIEVRLHIISSKIGEIENLTKVINCSNWEIEGIIPVSLACQRTLKQDSSALLLDIGNQTINCGLSFNNTLKYCQSFLFKNNLSECLREVKEIMERADDYDKADKIIISGGKTLTDGLAEKIEEIFNKPTKIGFPAICLQKDNLNFKEKEIMANPVWTVAIGLVRYGLEKRREKAEAKGIVKKIKRWVEGYF